MIYILMIWTVVGVGGRGWRYYEHVVEEEYDES